MKTIIKILISALIIFCCFNVSVVFIY